MNILTIMAIVASGISILSTIWMVSFKFASVLQRLDSLEKNGCDRLQLIDSKVTRLAVQMEPFWSLVETKIADSLKHPNTPEYDALLHKFSDSMSVNELDILRVYLEDDLEVSLCRKDQSRVLSLALVLARVKSRLNEGKGLKV